MKKLIIPAIILFTIACNNGEPAPAERTDGFSKKATTPEDSLFDEVMHGHDTAMAKMGKIGRYRKELQEKINAAEGSAKAALKELEAELKSAEDGMNKWMDEFEIDSAQNDIEKRIQYLTSEKLKVDNVKENILDAISKADSLLKK